MSEDQVNQTKQEGEGEGEPTEGDAAGATYTPGMGPEPTLGPKDVRRAESGEEEAQQLSRESRSAEGGGAADGTVDEVLSDVDSGKVTAQAALDAERQGKNRSTLVEQLQQRGAQ